MNIQNVIVGIIVFTALFYVGAMIWRKTKSFSPKNNSCENDCGCEHKTKSKIDSSYKST